MLLVSLASQPRIYQNVCLECHFNHQHSSESASRNFTAGIFTKMAPGESSRPSSHRPRDSSGRNHRHKKRRSQGHGTRRPATDSGESREERRSQTLSADALARLNEDNTRRHKKRRESNAERPRDAERRRARREEYRDAPKEKPKKVKREEDRDLPYEKPRKEHKSKKRRVVSGAVMEEGRSRGHLRGGGWSSSGHSIEKEYLMDDPPKPVKKRKKLCELS